MTNTNSPTVQILQAVGGGVSGAVTRFITQPFDVLKIRFQLQVEPLKSKQVKASKYVGMLQAFNKIYREEGVRGIWKGHLAGQMMSVTYAVIQFWSYEQLRHAAHQTPFFSEHMNLSYFLCGGIAGCMGTIAAQPFDVVRTRVVAADPDSGTSKLRPVSGAVKVFRNEGFRGISSGLMLTLLQIYPLVGANFLFYKIFNQMIVRMGEYITNVPNPKHTIPGPLLFVSGGLSGVLAKMIIYPADVVKKRSMLHHFEGDRKSFGMNPQCRSVRQCIVNTLKHEGFAGFYKGMLPTLYKSGVMSACYFTIYDYYNHYVTHSYQRYERSLEEEQKKHSRKPKKTSNW
ncbi:mitochondrial thiamine pyrophosphate carrier [Drosophila innubila]|uniref:mitochondrial thiamine pyrophosphate carrier n=1 Tax=Drosophila innubila TaxID=198719 RepID=UPI00148C8182|nr:mitochondrial thiamine pyrophosphate carrier [Drosophila innubila]